MILKNQEISYNWPLELVTLLNILLKPPIFMLDISGYFDFFHILYYVGGWLAIISSKCGQSFFVAEKKLKKSFMNTDFTVKILSK